MIILDVNQSNARGNERLPGNLIDRLSTQLNKVISNPPDGTIAVSYVSDTEIQRLNRMYREKDEVTDVLSFSYLDRPDKEGGIGDVAISLAQAKRQAKEGDLQLELVDLIVHGVLHVLGYDHKKPGEAKEMFSLQDSIVARTL